MSGNWTMSYSLPDQPVQAGHVGEMLITANQREPVLFRHCANPEVVVGNDQTCRGQLGLGASIEGCGFGVDGKQDDSTDKSSDPFEVFVRIWRPMRPKMEFAENGCWQIDGLTGF